MNENDSEEPTSGAAPGGTEPVAGPSDADISALLAGARVTGSIPDDVVARLGATLAELTAERRSARGAGTDENGADEPGADEPGVVVPLRRRVLAPRRLLAAAAAVLVVGGVSVGVSKVINSDTSSSSASTAAADNGAQAPKVGSAPGATSDLAGTAGGTTTTGTGIPRFRTASFAQDAASYLDVVQNRTLDLGASPSTGPPAADVPAPTAPRSPASSPSERSGLSGQTDGLESHAQTESQMLDPAKGYAAKVCPGPADPGGTVTRIELDGKPAVLVVHPPVDGHSLVEAWSCDGSAVLASASIAS